MVGIIILLSLILIGGIAVIIGLKMGKKDKKYVNGEEENIGVIKGCLNGCLDGCFLLGFFSIVSVFIIVLFVFKIVDFIGNLI